MSISLPEAEFESGGGLIYFIYYYIILYVIFLYFVRYAIEETCHYVD